MAHYVDGYVIPLKKSRVKDYLRMARLGAQIWKDHGALAYRECIAEDLDVPFGKGFRRMVGLKPGETVLFSWVVFRSRAHRDRVNAKAMKDPRMQDELMPKVPPFDARRMAMGGFEELIGW